jgi:hypothetical protein
MDRSSLEAIHAAMQGARDASPFIVVVRGWLIIERGGEGGTLHVLGLEIGDVWRRSSPISARDGPLIRTESGQFYYLDGPAAGVELCAELMRGWCELEARGKPLRRVE